MTPPVVYAVLALFATRSLAAAALGPRLPGFAARKTLDVPEPVRGTRVRRLRRLNAILAVALVALGVGLHAADRFLQHHQQRRAHATEG
jgi:hypothetical protein